MSPCSFILIPVSMSCFLEWFLLGDSDRKKSVWLSCKFHLVRWNIEPHVILKRITSSFLKNFAPSTSIVPISSMLGKSDNKSKYWIDMFYRYLPRVKGPTACLWVTTLLPSYRGRMFSSCYHQKPSTELHQKPRHQLKSTEAVDDSA